MLITYLLFVIFSASSSSGSSSSGGSVNGESFYLHNPQEVIYNRVKDLFESTNQRQSLSALTGKHNLLSPYFRIFLITSFITLIHILS